MRYTAAVLTISDKGAAGERIDTAGPAVCDMLKDASWDVTHTCIIPDEKEQIQKELIHLADTEKVALILTVGGTGFSPRDVTPEATEEVLDKKTPGIPELMRAESFKITPRACLSRTTAGIRGKSLIVNLPGSEKAAKENLTAVISSLFHGVDMMRKTVVGDGCAMVGKILAVCTSEKKGEIKRPVSKVQLVPDCGIPTDAHHGNWHRQVSLLAKESVKKMEDAIGRTLAPGCFAENILMEGFCLYTLPVGTKLEIGTATAEVTQIGKECHQDCAIRKETGDCVMPREGIFVKILTEGEAGAGDFVKLLTKE